MTLFIHIADMTIKIVHTYPYLVRLCKDYIVNETEDFAFSIEIDESDILAEQSEIDAKFSPGYLESLAVYRKIATKILDFGGCLVHGVLMEMDGRGILLCAPSGVGKTTHAKLWQECFGSERCHIVNGDKPLVFLRDGKLYGYGTPWCGKECLSENRSVALSYLLYFSRKRK